MRDYLKELEATFLAVMKNRISKTLGICIKDMTLEYDKMEMKYRLTMPFNVGNTEKTIVYSTLHHPSEIRFLLNTVSGQDQVTKLISSLNQKILSSLVRMVGQDA